MAINDLFFKRMKRERGEYPDVYQYDDLPQPLRVQFVHLWYEFLCDNSFYSRNISALSEKLCRDVCEVLCRELGVFWLTDKNRGWGFDTSYFNEIKDFFLSEQNFDIAMSVVELMAQVVNDRLQGNEKFFSRFSNELNQRFREHGVGYELHNFQLIKIDSQLIHKEVVLPTLGFLSQSIYKGANEDFLNAHEHYRHQRYAECLNDCLKAYESTLKIILTKRNWAFDKNATLNQLVKIALDNELIPSFWLNNFNNLNGLLTSGINVGRNKLSGHGQGNQRDEIPEYLVAYMLHMTASTILFLVKADEDFGS